MTSSKKSDENEVEPPLLNPSPQTDDELNRKLRQVERDEIASKAQAMSAAARVYLNSNGDPQAMVRHLERLEQQKAKADKKPEIGIEEEQ